ncbi:AAA family ATPase [Nocardiopsis sp. ARC36]
MTFVVGSGGAALRLPAPVDGLPSSMEIPAKFVGERGLVERCVVTLAGERGLLLVGEPGTAKSLLSELLAAAVSGTGSLTVQGTAGTTEEHLRYGWNYALLLAKGPTVDALAPSRCSRRCGRAASSGSRRSPAACPRSRTPWSRCSPTGGWPSPSSPTTGSSWRGPAST